MSYVHVAPLTNVSTNAGILDGFKINRISHAFALRSSGGMVGA